MLCKYTQDDAIVTEYNSVHNILRIYGFAVKEGWSYELYGDIEMGGIVKNV